MKQIQNIKEWLNRPFPYTESNFEKIAFSVAFGLFIFLFLTFFQPFGIQEIETYKILYLSGYGTITFLGMMINFFVMPLIFPDFFDIDKWCVKKHIIFCMMNMFLIVLLNWVYDSFFGHFVSKNLGLLHCLIYTLSVGLIPTILLTMQLERRFWKKHSLIAEDVTQRLNEQDLKNENSGINQIILLSDNMKERLELSEKDLICISSEGNYSNICYFDNGEVSEKLMRMSLKTAEDNLSDFDKIVRCHKSHIVNMHMIESVGGNARSFKLHMRNIEYTIPVSRSFPRTIIDQLKNKTEDIKN